MLNKWPEAQSDNSAEKIWQQYSVIIQHINFHPHIANMTKHAIKKVGWEVLLHSPYSPDLAPSEYHLCLVVF